jgi:hypothetical protein
MRFSLASLLLVILWVAVGLGVWLRPEPWQKFTDSASRAEANIFRDADTVEFSATVRRISETDHDYHLDNLQGPGLAGLMELTGFLESLPLRVGESANYYGFKTSDCVAIQKLDKEREREFHIFRRRYPREWWGHFYRPEVWAFAVLTVVLIVRAVRSRRASVLGRQDVGAPTLPQDMK